MPAIALTAYSREQDRRLALEAGFQTHVTKPIEPAELVRVVGSLVRFVARQSSPEQVGAALERADAFLKFEKILDTQGVHEALKFLNSRTSHRFTAMYRFDPPMLHNLLMVDSYTPSVRTGDDAPLVETYCSIVGTTHHNFTTEDTRMDDRLRDHPARHVVISYCGVPLHDADGAPFGTLCHFDLVPSDIPVAEIPLMEAAAPLLMGALAKEMPSAFRAR
jgi:response regulator RpfG family c-di-GMP phosphodiesterase